MAYHRPYPLSVHPFSAVGRGHKVAGLRDDTFPMMGPVRRAGLASWFCGGQQALLRGTPVCIESARPVNESDAYCCFPATIQCSTPFPEHNIIPFMSARRRRRRQPTPPFGNHHDPIHPSTTCRNLCQALAAAKSARLCVVGLRRGRPRVYFRPAELPRDFLQRFTDPILMT